MESIWRQRDPVAQFWERLLNDNVDRLLRDPEKFLLKHMRYDHDFLRDYQRRFGTVLKARGLNLYRLVAEACGEVWDNEDDEKGCFQPKKESPMDQRKCRQLGSPTSNRCTQREKRRMRVTATNRR